MIHFIVAEKGGGLYSGCLFLSVTHERYEERACTEHSEFDSLQYTQV